MVMKYQKRRKTLAQPSSLPQRNLLRRSGVPPLVENVIHSPGQSLDTNIRSLMETRLGHDFSNVRIYTDTRAAESAKSVNALAYTVGSNVIFGIGQYKPQTRVGQRLLAHELAHVVQQDRGNASPSPLPDNPLERAANQAESAIMQSNNSMQVSGASGPGLARQPKQSLSQSLSDTEIEQEIEMIRLWLMDNPSSSTERNQALERLQMLEKMLRQRGLKQAGKIKTTTRTTKTSQQDFMGGLYAHHHLLNKHLELKLPLPKVVDLNLHWDPTKTTMRGITYSPLSEAGPGRKAKDDDKPAPELQAGGGMQETQGDPSQTFSYAQITASYSNWYRIPVKNLPNWLASWMKSVNFIGESGLTFQFHIAGAAQGSVDAQAVLKLMQLSFRAAQGTTNLSLQVGGTVSDIGKGQPGLSQRAAPFIGIEAESDIGQIGPAKLTAAIDGQALWQFDPGKRQRVTGLQFSGELRISIDF